jgi:hypothetical protein
MFRVARPVERKPGFRGFGGRDAEKRQKAEGRMKKTEVSGGKKAEVGRPQYRVGAKGRLKAKC